MKSKYFFCVIVLVFLQLTGCNKDDPVSPVFNDYTKDFDSVWTNFDLNYPLFDYKKIDWKSSYNQYKNKFRGISVSERNDLLVSFLSVFKDPHIYFTTPDGKGFSTYWPKNYLRNYNSTYISKFKASMNWHAMDSLWGWGITKNIGYIKIVSLRSSDMDTIVFANILDSLINTSGIIIDLRENTGGNLDICEGLLNDFADEEKIVGYQRYRNGINHNDYAPEIPVVTRPNNKFSNKKKIVVLIGQGCGSAGEILAETMSRLPNVTLIGNTTLGAVEAPSTFSLADGTEYTVPIVAYLDAEHNPLEWKGVLPDIYIDPAKVVNDTEADNIIIAAFNVITSTAPIAKSSKRSRIHELEIPRNIPNIRPPNLPKVF